MDRSHPNGRLEGDQSNGLVTSQCTALVPSSAYSIIISMTFSLLLKAVAVRALGSHASHAHPGRSFIVAGVTAYLV